MSITPLCGAENSDYPGEYSCTLPAGHPPVVYEGGEWDHAAPTSGAWWNNLDTQGLTKVHDPHRDGLLAVSRTSWGRAIEAVSTTLEADDRVRVAYPKSVALTVLCAALAPLGLTVADAPSECRKRGPYYPVGDIDWECVTHGVELVRVGGDGPLRMDVLACPVGEPGRIATASGPVGVRPLCEHREPAGQCTVRSCPHHA